MNIQKKIFKRFYKHTLVFIVLLGIGSALIELSSARQKSRYLDMQTTLLNTKYETNYKYFKIMSNDIYTMYQDNSGVIDLITQANDADETKRGELRDKLYSQLKKRYKRLSNMGVMQIHFHLPDNSSFLRMNNPKKFGDDLSQTRQSVVLTNETKKPQEGFEIGKTTHGFRFIYPLFSDKMHIGSMEVSFSSEKLRDAILDNFMIDSHFLISKDEISKYLPAETIERAYEQSKEHPDFLLESSSHHNADNTNVEKNILTENLTDTIFKKISSGTAFSVANSFNYESVVGTFIPMKNVSEDKTIAYMVVYTESDHLDNLMIENRYINMLFASTLFLLFVFSIYVTINRDKLREMAHFDKLTSLPNRANFYIELAKELNRANRFNQKFAIMFIDLDGFKAVNDSYGHHIGDQLLIEVSRRVRNSVRGADIVARLGGDEFTAILTDIKDKNDAIFVAQKIINKLSEDFLINKNILNIGASIGISLFPDDGTDSDTLIKHADRAMYQAKERGKNCAVIHQ